jgi:hypothetical protein
MGSLRRVRWSNTDAEMATSGIPTSLVDEPLKETSRKTTGMSVRADDHRRQLLVVPDDSDVRGLTRSISLSSDSREATHPLDQRDEGKRFRGHARLVEEDNGKVNAVKVSRSGGKAGGADLRASAGRQASVTPSRLESMSHDVHLQHPHREAPRASWFVSIRTSCRNGVAHPT